MNQKRIIEDKSDKRNNEIVPSEEKNINKKLQTSNESEVSRKFLVNRLNYINFQNETILLTLKCKKSNTTIIKHVIPQPCTGEILECIWAEPEECKKFLKTHVVENLLVADNQNLMQVKPEVTEINSEKISLILPEKCIQNSSRKVKREFCKKLKVRILQNGLDFNGSLIDFSSVSFKVRINANIHLDFNALNTKASVNVEFFDNERTLYSGECNIIKQTKGRKKRNIVLEPINFTINRFEPNEFRSTRQELVPLPNILFEHPFTGKRIALKIMDISGSGFSVEEHEVNSVLLPGMIITDLKICFGNIIKISCITQVVYKNLLTEDKENNRIKVGLAIIDMDHEGQVLLSGLLHQAENKNSYVCNHVEMDELWEFFFETGFIYPKKYKFVEANKNKIKRTYEKLYTQNLNIARHFTYMNKGIILGHMSMLKFYENSWLIHHHAARKIDAIQAGLSVMNQIGRFTYETYRMNSSHMDYLLCYYRPNNPYPNFFFGGVQKDINNNNGCSIDPFAYCHFTNSKMGKLPRQWSISEVSENDLQDFKKFYDTNSGGLAVSALDLNGNSVKANKLTGEYKKIGLKRERFLFSLKLKDQLKALIIVNVSDIGLNLSELTNSVNIFVVDSELLEKDILHHVYSYIVQKYKQEDMPVLIYPVSFADKVNISYEKIYNLWILYMKYSDEYFRFIYGIQKSIKH